MNSEPPPSIAKDEKLRLEARNRALLEEDLTTGRLVFASRPREVEIQLSNFCNMSCTMCYDGVNPPTKRLPEPVVEALAAELFPTASVFIPFVTSEPLVLTWDLTRKLARQYGVELEITTNVQFLDEKKLEELEPLVGEIHFSIDSHIRETYEAIRLKSRPDDVFRNLPIAARYLRERGVGVSANIVLMTENAPHIHDTVAFLADAGIPSINIQRLFYFDPERHSNDPLVQWSPARIADLKERVIRVAEEKKIRVKFEFERNEIVDRRPADAVFRPTRMADVSPRLVDLWRTYPGYCPQSVMRLKVDNEGNAYPCCFGGDERLKLGNVTEQTIEEIWNGPTNQDLRRGMLTGDLPDLCVKCDFRKGFIHGEHPNLPFCDAAFPEVGSERWTIELLDPPHLARTTEAPTFRWERLCDLEIDHYEIAFSLGGTSVDGVFPLDADATSFEAPAHLWDAMAPNAAYWWTICAVAKNRSQSRRGRTVRCFIHHRPMPRVPGSMLEYS